MRSWLTTEVCDLAHCAFSRPLEDGDIVNIDITIYLDGYHGDTSRTFLVGNVVSRFLHIQQTCIYHHLGWGRAQSSYRNQRSPRGWNFCLRAWAALKIYWTGHP